MFTAAQSPSSEGDTFSDERMKSLSVREAKRGNLPPLRGMLSEQCFLDWSRAQLGLNHSSAIRDLDSLKQHPFSKSQIYIVNQG